MRSGPLFHDNVRTCLAQRGRPPRRILKEERLLRAGNKVRARNPTRHHLSRFVARTRRGAEDRTVDVGMPEPKSERELSTRRGTEHRGAFSGQRYSKPRLCPLADIFDEELLMCREPFSVKDR